MNKSIFDSKLLIKLGFTLLAITAITAVLLASVNATTYDIIQERKLEARNKAIQEVLPGSTMLEDLTATTDFATVYTMELADGSRGYCVEVAPQGFGGPITMIVGIEIVGSEKRVTGVSITAMSETGGLGTKARDVAFLSQYTGIVVTGPSSGISVGTGEGQIDAISGATVTSKAVTNGVNIALDAVQTSSEGGTSN